MASACRTGVVPAFTGQVGRDLFSLITYFTHCCKLLQTTQHIKKPNKRLSREYSQEVILLPALLSPHTDQPTLLMVAIFLPTVNNSLLHAGREVTNCRDRSPFMGHSKFHTSVTISGLHTLLVLRV